MEVKAHSIPAYRWINGIACASLKIRVKESQYAAEKSVGTLQTKLKKETLAGNVTIIFHHKGTTEYCGYVVSTSASHSGPRFKTQSSFCYPR